MELTEITAISPVDGRYGRKTAVLRPYCSEHGLIHRRILAELRWFEALCDEPDLEELPGLSKNAKEFLSEIVSRFSPEDSAEIKRIEAETNHDVKAVEYFLKARFATIPELAKHAEFLHFACTSEDINNLAYAVMLRDLYRDVILPGLEHLSDALGALARQHAGRAMLARTHGQPASPTTLGKEIANTQHRLRRQIRNLSRQEYCGKINGAVGNFNAHQVAYPRIDWQTLARQCVESLGLTWNSHTTQIEPHDWMAELFQAQSRANTILLDFCRDLWAYISLGYFRQKTVAGEVGSSTMPHKVNPIDFENAEGNFGVANALLQHLAEKLPVSRLQRDLTDSTVLRCIGETYGHVIIGMNALVHGLSRLEVDDRQLDADLDGHWEVLAEPIQTVMRRYGLDQPYEQLKALTRGRQVSRADFRQFIQGLDIPADAKETLLSLTPATYIGIAAKLAKL